MSRVPEHILQAIRDRLPLSGIIGRSVRLKRTGADHIGLCPFHDERSPSFTVNDGKGFYHCFGCGAHGDIFRWLAENEGLDFRASVARAGEMAGVDTRQWTAPATGHLTDAVSKPVSTRIDPAEIEAARQRRHAEEALRIARSRDAGRQMFREAQPIEGSLSHAYLRGRGITITLPPSLRHHPRLACWQFPDGAYDKPVLAGHFPALVGAVQAPDGQIGGCWRIYLACDVPGDAARRPPTHTASPDVVVRKADHREGVSKAKLGRGPVRGGAVRLADWRASDGKGDALAISEGIETGLSAVQCGWPAWAALSTGGIRRLVLPAGVRRVLVICDHDSPGVEAALSRVAEWRGEGRRVELILPVIAGLDLNDLLQEAARKMKVAA